MSGRQQNRRAAVDGKPSAKATLVKRFKDGERQAEDTLTRWIGHPALQPVVERRRLGAEAVVLPISRLLTGQGEVVRPTRNHFPFMDQYVLSGMCGQ